MPPIPIPEPAYRAAMAAGLKHVYHGELADRVTRYVPTSPLPAGLSGRVLFTAFPHAAIFDVNTARFANPHLLTAPGRLLSIDLDAGVDGEHVLATRFLDVQSQHLRALAPAASVRTDFAEVSWLGIANLVNTAPIPTFEIGSGGRRLVVSYDAGRPTEVNPRELSQVGPVGGTQDYESSVGSSFSPMILTTGHPVYDPDFDSGRPALLFTNVVPRVLDFLTPSSQRAVRGDLFVTTWDGSSHGPARPLRVHVDGEPVTMEQASAHQLSLTRDHLLVFNSNLVLNTWALVEPILGLLTEELRRKLPALARPKLDALWKPLEHFMRPPVPSTHCDLYVIRKDALRGAIARGARRVDALRVRLPGELSHALVDWDDTAGQLRIYAQHNLGADPADQLHEEDVLATGDRVHPDYLGLFTSSTDLNQVRKHVVHVSKTSAVLGSTHAFPDPTRASDFRFGVNLLPPCQPLAYERAGGASAASSLAAQTRVQTHTYWVAGGYLPETLAVRPFDDFRRHRVPGERLVPEAEYLERLVDSSNTTKLFRLDADLALESAYAFPPGWLMGAPVWVPRAGGTTMKDGWLIGCVWGPDASHVEVWIFDGQQPLSVGPVSKLMPAPGERGLRPGFPLHGSWVDRTGIDAWSRPELRTAIVDLPLYVKVAETGVMAGSFLRRALQQLLER
ncbi:carotenoid oxygenase family protein [Pyxidicoccus xibeiensis]|uniref:carotenoid oxygenase family protein n=1 Tax=Pyxidicoccus xibeiensis TaxID=2906759 RepID=UPI0020A7959F|nr:carotenoid oxygenase family protein [Pyxidicoccus xibeiensis]MCP3137778.1 carotenoid oxygenase family protein [Pyxidicoccus xibeiensis]